MINVILHLLNEDPVVCEIEDLPNPSDYLLTVRNPRRKDGKDLQYLEPNVNTVIFPMFRISFLEIIESHEEEIITFVRE
jgi:hypothetical protein